MAERGFNHKNFSETRCPRGEEPSPKGCCNYLFVSWVVFFIVKKEPQNFVRLVSPNQ